MRTDCIGPTRGTLPKLRIERTVISAIARSIGMTPAEQGGMLGGRREDGIVRVFYHDRSALRSCVTYSPDCREINRLLSEDWNPRGVNLLGFVHSHPSGAGRPSEGDLEYACRILEGIPDLDRLFLPIVMTKPDTGRFEILPYVALREGTRVSLQEAMLEYAAPEAIEVRMASIPEAETRPMVAGVALPATPAPAAVASAPVPAVAPGPKPAPMTQEPPLMPPVRRIDVTETFKRVVKAYDLDRMDASRVILVGCGGAAQYAEDLARAGLGEFVLVDPDAVSESNLATQQCYRRDVGRAKVDCIAERIKDINPNAKVKCVSEPLDALDDSELYSLARAPLRNRLLPGGPITVELPSNPDITVLCGLTDNFWAQARINRLAIKFGLPSLCAQVYAEGRGAEITFTYPGVTSACHRCALSSRYDHYRNRGYRNDVTSDGTPIFASGRLNALKGYVTLALIHHGTGHPTWGGLLSRIGQRNLVRIRLNPDFEPEKFAVIFKGADQERILFDETVWLPQKPDCPENGFPTCPDCGGTGDLSARNGKCPDTRISQKEGSPCASCSTETTRPSPTSNVTPGGVA